MSVAIEVAAKGFAWTCTEVIAQIVGGISIVNK